ADAAKTKSPPRDAWIMECVQEDRTNPLPCSEEDKKAWPNGQPPEEPETAPEQPMGGGNPQAAVTTDAGAPDLDNESEQDLEALIMGGGSKDGGAAGAGSKGDGGVGSAAPAPAVTTTDQSED